MTFTDRTIDLGYDTPEQVVDWLRNHSASGPAHLRAAVELLIAAYNGRLLLTRPVYEAIRLRDGRAIEIRWERLADLAALLTNQTPDTRDAQDATAFYQAGIPREAAFVLATAAALGAGQVPEDVSRLLAGAYRVAARAGG